jgi:hypothetical protein
MYDVLLYGMLELALGLEHDADNPYDPAEIVVDVELARPDGVARTWPAYFDGEAWMFRYRPLLEGEHSGVILLDGEAVGSFVFHVEPSTAPGPVHPDGWGFRHADGSPFVPLGLNLGWSAGGGTEDYARWFAALEEHGGSFARIWFTHFTDQDPEWPALGRMDPTAAANIDTILDLALEHGVLLMPVLWQHSELESSMWSSWEGNPYNEANGGPCADSACFFEDPEALAHQHAYLRYCVARWGAHPALAAWEVMNELDGIVGVDSDVTAAWAAGHAETIRELEAALHPVSFSYSLPPQAVEDQAWEGADFTQIHSYLLSDVEPVTTGVATSLDLHGRPVLVGEWGLDWFGNSDREDREGLAWHNASWAALSSGSAGNALTWWWDDHVEPDDLWWRLEGLAAVSAGLDLSAMGPVEATVSDGDLEVFARSDGDVTLAWVHIIEHTVPDPEDDPVSGATLVLGGIPVGVTFLDTRDGSQVGTWTVACEGVIDLPEITGDLAVLIEDDGFSCDEPPEGCGCAGRPRGGGLSVGLLAGLLGLSRRRRQE